MKMIFTLFVAVVVLNCRVVTAQVNVQDSLALVDLYNSTFGPQWIDNTNWLSATPVGGWYGITLTDNSQRVKEINLGYNNLTGWIPESVGNLDSLQVLQLYNSHVGGKPFPASIGNIRGLKKLLLSKAGFTGSLPATLGNLVNLEVLQLDENKLSGNIPASLANLVGVTYIDLSRNPFGGDIPPFENLVKLQTLKMTYCNLQGSIPAGLGNSSSLKFLDLSYNQLSGSIPSSLGNLSALSDLVLTHNQLTGSIPSDLGNLQRLIVLKLNRNQLSGSIPASLSHLSVLDYMNLSENQLTGSIPPEFGNLTKVTYLSFSYNQLTGVIPTSLDTIPDLAELYLNYNHLTGPISPLLKRGTDYGMGNWRSIHGNKFTFEGTESIGTGTVYSSIIYAPQDTVLPLHFNGGILSVSAGGTLSNNTYRWYKDNQLMSTITGDSTFVPAQNGNYTVTVTNKVADKLTLFSDTFDVHTLPVTFLGFTAHLENSSALLNWQNATEINSAWFNVQRSVGGGGFTTIDKIPAAGNSHKVMSYTYKDTDAAKRFSGRIYYRLQQVDKDGAVTNSKIIAVNPGAGEWNFTLTPNPATDEVQVSLNNMPGKIQLAIFNLNGQKVAYREITGTGSHKAVISIAPLPAGVYVLQVFCNGQQKQQKFIKR